MEYENPTIEKELAKIDAEVEDELSRETVMHKNWPFKPDDWLVNHIFCQAELIHLILTIKNYKYNQIASLVLDLYEDVSKLREKLENEDVAFQKKKAYLLKAEKNGDKSIQIPLEGEYSLKKYVTLYKIYELIGWFARLRGESTIFKICILEKQKLIEKIVPIADLSIRKVIGAKIVNRRSDQFEDAISNAWVSIINFLPKIDPSRVMFSLFVSIANKSAYFFMARHLKHVYNTVQLSILEEKMNQTDNIDGEFFLSSVANKNEGITNESNEDKILEKIDAENEAENDKLLREIIDLDTKEVLQNMTPEAKNEFTRHLYNLNRSESIEQRILSYAFTILSGKIRKVCYQKIYAEFFIDLIEQNIPRKIISKYADLFLNVINFDDLSSIDKMNDEVNDALLRMLKGWIKAKQESKLKTNVNKENKYDKKVEREQKIYEYIRDNKNALEELIQFRKDCLQFKITIDDDSK